MNRGAAAPSPTQPEARRQKVANEWLTTTEMQQIDITARDAVRLQREVPTTPVEGSAKKLKVPLANATKQSTNHREGNYLSTLHSPRQATNIHS